MFKKMFQFRNFFYIKESLIAYLIRVLSIM